MLLVAHLLSGSLMVGLPLFLGALIIRRWKLDWALFGLGGLTFIASQVLHIPFNMLLLNPWLAKFGWLRETGWPYVLGAVLVGLSAGVFEEGARFLILRRNRERMEGWREGVLYGLGHGGVEAIILGAFVFYALIQALALRGIALEEAVPLERLEIVRLQLQQYWGMAWYEPLWAVLERLSAMSFHLLASLLVLKAVRQRKPLWLGAAVLGHTAFNAMALVALSSIGVAGTELLLAGVGAACLWLAFDMRSQLEPGSRLHVESAPEVEVALDKPMDDSSEIERLDESRFM